MTTFTQDAVVRGQFRRTTGSDSAEDSRSYAQAGSSEGHRL